MIKVAKKRGVTIFILGIARGGWDGDGEPAANSA
jgi:hypothetical protein